MELLFEFELEYDEQSTFGKDPQKDWEYLLSEINRIDPELDIPLIEKAFRYCVDMHKGVDRKSGLPYYTHPLNVTLILLREFSHHDSNSLAACLLHDVIEDVKGVKKHHIAELFNPDVAEIVDSVTKIAHREIRAKIEDVQQTKQVKLKEKAETYRKLFLALVKDIRVILIKFADRLHNLRTLHYLPDNKQKEIALETLNFYTPLAHRLGLNKVKMEFENRSFFYSERDTYEAIRMALTEKRRDFLDYIKVFSDHITNSLREHSIEHILTIVHKHEYEIYQMIEEGLSISDIDNFYSMVIIVDSDDVMECYRAHGVLANAFNTIKFVDYISNPKIDWFKALKTELFGPDGKRVEILIRSSEMEKISEEGFASKFSLRSGRIRALQFSDNDIIRWGDWMQDMIEHEGTRAAQIIWDAIKVNLFDSELSVFTKEGRTITLPKGATLIDFAFNKGYEWGLNLITAKVNGVLKDITHKLKNGDQVEIITSPNMLPKPEWKNNVISHKAVVALHNYFKENPVEDEIKKQKTNFMAKLVVSGDDREGMLSDISAAIGQNNIVRINLDTSGTNFEGAITVKVADARELNQIFARLLGVKGIRSVEKFEEEL
jgi:GTP pyrophosphokinase